MRFGRGGGAAWRHGSENVFLNYLKALIAQTNFFYATNQQKPSTNEQQFYFNILNDRGGGSFTQVCVLSVFAHERRKWLSNAYIWTDCCFGTVTRAAIVTMLSSQPISSSGPRWLTEQRWLAGEPPVLLFLSPSLSLGLSLCQNTSVYLSPFPSPSCRIFLIVTCNLLPLSLSSPSVCLYARRSWQTLRFEKQPASFIRIVGTHNTANEVRGECKMAKNVWPCPYTVPSKSIGTARSIPLFFLYTEDNWVWGQKLYSQVQNYWHLWWRWAKNTLENK